MFRAANCRCRQGLSGHSYGSATRFWMMGDDNDPAVETIGASLPILGLVAFLIWMAVKK